MVISIRAFEANDQQVVKQLILSGLADHFGNINPELNPDLDDIAVRYADDVFLVALENDQIIGCGALVKKDKITGEIVRMSVERSLRSRGIGRQILAALCDQARRAGFRRVVLETTATWQRVRSFYEASGFSYTHFIDDEFGGQAHYELML